MAGGSGISGIHMDMNRIWFWITCQKLTFEAEAYIILRVPGYNDCK